MKKDLGIKIGTKKESLWTTIKENAERDIDNSEIQKEISIMIRDRAEKHIEEEKNASSNDPVREA